MSFDLPELSKVENKRPLPWPSDAFLDSGLNGIQGVCLDIDETLSTQGKLTGEAYQALWGLKSAGFWVVPITGRPAGWCDHFARFWPVDAVIGENGAFTFYMEGGLRKRLETPDRLEQIQRTERLRDLAVKIKSHFPHACWASDQSYREFDLAVDICEDVEPWARSEVDRLLEFCRREGAHAKVSSIHVNVWLGDYDKKSGFDFWLSRGAPGGHVAKGQVQVPGQDQWLYIGDSPNDEPLFASFKYSVGVANLVQYLDRMSAHPTWMTQGQSGAGFCEMARSLISLKEKKL